MHYQYGTIELMGFINMLISIVIMIVTDIVIQMKSFLDDAEHQTSTWSPGYQGSPGLRYQYVHIEYTGIHEYADFFCHYDCYYHNYPN